MNDDTVHSKTEVNNQQRKSWTMKLKFILDKTKQSIGVNKYEQPTGTITTTFLKPMK